MKKLLKNKFSTSEIKHIFKKHKLLLRSIAVILVLTLLFTSMPLDGFAALAEQAIEDSKLITVVEELEEYRTEFSKTYLKSDGTLEAVVSSNAIHYEQDGEWMEINSTLEITENADGEEVYQNKKGPFKVNLPTELENGSVVEIVSGENEISIKLLDNKKSKGKKNNSKKEKAEKLTKAQRKRMTAGELFEADNNQLSTLEYTEVYSGTDLRYDVTPTEVKESIILNKAPNKKATYSYEITADGLAAMLNSDGSIDFFEASNSEAVDPVFSMPAPHMFDSNDVYSYDIETTLENKNGKYILTYKPSYEWLKSKDRAYPVTLDPTVTVNSGIQDSYIFSGEGYADTYLGYEQQLKVGTTAWLAPNDYWQTYLKFTDLPEIPYEDYRIDSAYLMLTPKGTTGSWEEMELGVYELTEDWKNHETGKVAERITFNNAPEDVGYSTATASVSRGGADNGIGVGFEIAHLVEKWYDSPETNYGIKLAAHLSESEYNDNLVFHSSRSQTGTAPYLSLTYTEYVPVTGIEIVGKQERLEYWLSFNAFEVSATVYPENATNKEVIWESTNESAAYFYGDRIICAAGVGTTTIIAKSADNNEIIDSFELEVYNIPIETLTITNRPENDTLESGETHQLSFEVGPDNATDKYFVESSPSYIAWSSNNTDVAYVDSEGKLTAGCYGTATITASYGDIVDSFTLTVAGIETTGVSAYIEPIYNPMYIGETWVFSGAVEPLNATDKRTVCTSLNPDVVSVDSLETSYSYETEHTLTALSEGTATIRLEAYNDSSVYYEFTVSVSTFDEELGLNLPYNNTLVKGDTWQITTNPNNTITIGDPSIISKAGNGYITALNPGTTTIEISTRSGTEYFAHREITVIETCDLQITGRPEVLYVGQTYEELSVTKTPDVGGNVVWSSSDDTVAEVYYDYVRARAVLVGKKEGTATIYAEIPGALACAEAQIKVEKLKVTGVGINTSEELTDGVIYLGEQARLKLDIYPKEPVMADFETVSWDAYPEGAMQINYNSKYLYNLYTVAPADIEIQAIVDGVASAALPVTVKELSATITNKPTNMTSVDDYDELYLLATGTTHKLNYKCDPEYSTIAWETNKPGLIDIDPQTGEITTVSDLSGDYADALIILHAKIGDNIISDAFSVRVIDIDSVSINGAPSNKLTVGESYDLSAVVYPQYSYVQGVTWSLDSNSIVNSNKYADLDANGKLVLKADGIITVYAKSKIDNTKYFPLEIVIYPEAEGITITNVANKKLNLTVDETFQLEYSITPDAVLDKTVSWNSLNPEIADVDNSGKITAYTAGTATIVATSNANENKSYSITVEVARHSDPFHHTNIEYMRYTKIPDSDGDFLLCVMKSSLNSVSYFSAIDINGKHEKYFIISSELKATLISMNDKYLENNSVATNSEKLVNLSKKYTDDLVLKDYITSNSDEYYGVWAYNYEAFCEKGNILSMKFDRALKAYNVYLILSGYYHSTLLPKSTQTLTTMQYKSLYNQIDDVATFMTKNPNSNKVMLGTTTDDIAWYKVGEKEKMTYFYSPNWDSLVSYYTDDIMIAANKQFLFTQKAAGKQFWFSHNPMTTLQNYPNSSFAMELNWLKDSYGLSQLTQANFVPSGTYWYFVP